VVLPEEVQGLRAFGSETEMEAIGGVMARHLETMRNKHAITLEHLRMGALKGKILDADGSELVDLFDEFDITAQSVSFEFSTAADNGQIKTACLELLGLMEDGLTGEFSTGVHVLCSTEFFRALTTHKEVKTAYQNWQQGAVLINDMRSGFSYSGITFEEYRGQASFVQADGTLGSRRFIAAGEAHAFPVGTVDTFATYFAPADFNETVNTIGQPLYAKQEPRKFDRGTDLHTQSNPLPMCHRPGVLIKLTLLPDGCRDVVRGGPQCRTADRRHGGGQHRALRLPCPGRNRAGWFRAVAGLPDRLPGVLADAGSRGHRRGGRQYLSGARRARHRRRHRASRLALPTLRNTP
jgi:hypothetical protein